MRRNQQGSKAQVNSEHNVVKARRELLDLGSFQLDDRSQPLDLSAL
jgi:hypothetical protein